MRYTNVIIVIISMIMECFKPESMVFADICPAIIPEKKARMMPMMNISCLFPEMSNETLKEEKLEMKATFISYAAKR